MAVPVKVHFLQLYPNGAPVDDTKETHGNEATLLNIKDILWALTDLLGYWFKHRNWFKKRSPPMKNE